MIAILCYQSKMLRRQILKYVIQFLNTDDYASMLLLVLTLKCFFVIIIIFLLVFVFLVKT